MDIMDKATIEIRKTLRQVFEEDPNLRYNYVVKVTNLLHDRYNIRIPTANDMAESIINLLFLNKNNGDLQNEL